MKKINYHDRFFKEVMSKKENAVDFLNNYLPKSILKQIDLSSIEIAKDSFIEEAKQEIYSDLLSIQENLIGHEKEQLNFQYQLYDLSKYSDEEIKGEIEIRIFLYLLKNIFRPKSDTVLESIVNLLDELSQKQIS